jgi:integrase
MAKRHRHLLSPTEASRAKPRAKPYRLADGGGLYLWVPVSGVKVWQFRYRHGGKPQTATLGKFSDTQSLAWARGRADEARSRVEDGDHLTRVKAVRKATKRAASAATFGALSEAWIASEARRARWTPDYRDEVEASLKNHLDDLNGLPVSAINAAVAAPHLRRVERNAPDMAKKVRQRLRAILDYAVENGLVPMNPIPAPRRRKGAGDRAHLPALVDRKTVGNVLRKADQLDVGRGVKRAHLLAAFTAQRMSEIVLAEWSEFDLVQGMWAIPRDRMKRKDVDRGPHVVPLPPGLLAQIKEWRRADGKEAVYVCPSRSGNGAITREAVEKFYRRALALSGKHSPHSWRTVLSTWANDAGEDSDAVEAQLDHATGNKVKAAYDRAKRLQRRADLMAWHEAALLAARDGAEVLAFKQRDRA